MRCSCWIVRCRRGLIRVIWPGIAGGQTLGSSLASPGCDSWSRCHIRCRSWVARARPLSMSSGLEMYLC
jgi:hypothetical protein